MVGNRAQQPIGAPAPPGNALSIWGPLALLWVLWGSTYLGIAVVVGVLPPLLSTGLRLAGGALLLAVGLAIASGPPVLRISRRQLVSCLLLGIGMPGIGLGALSMAERYVPSGIAALVIAAIPLWFVLLRIRSGDRPAALTLIGVAVGLVGLAYLLLPGGTVPRTGSDTDVVLWTAVLLVSSFTWAFASWRSGSMDVPTNSLVGATYQLLFAGVFVTIAGLLLGERLDLSVVNPIVWTAWISLAVASAIGYATYVWLIARAPLSLVGTYAYVNPLIAVILGALVLGEVISRDVIWGLIVVLSGVVLVVRGERATA